MPKRIQKRIKQKQKQKQSISVVINNNSGKSKRSRKSNTKSSGSSGGSSFYQQMPPIIIQPVPQAPISNQQQPNVIHYNAPLPNKVSDQNDISRSLTKNNLNILEESEIFMTPKSRQSRQSRKQDEFIYSPIVGKAPSILEDMQSISTTPISNNMDETFTINKPREMSPPKSNRKKKKPQKPSPGASSIFSTDVNNLGNIGRTNQNTPMIIPDKPPTLEPYLHSSRPTYLNTLERSEMKFQNNLAQTGFDINPLRGNQVNDDILNTSRQLPRPYRINETFNKSSDADISMIPTVGSPKNKSRGGRPKGSKNKTPKTPPNVV